MPKKKDYSVFTDKQLNDAINELMKRRLIERVEEATTTTQEEAEAVEVQKKSGKMSMKTVGKVSTMALMAGKDIYFSNARYANYASGASQKQLQNDYVEKTINETLSVVGSVASFGVGLATLNPVLIAGGAIGLATTYNRVNLANKNNKEQINRENYARTMSAQVSGYNISQIRGWR